MVRVKLRVGLVLLLAFVMIGGTVGCVAKNNSAGMPALQADGTMLVKGKARKVSVEQGILKVKAPKAKKAVEIKVTGETIFKNIASLAEIKKYQPVEVIYKVVGTENIAISVRPIPEGSC